MPKITKSQLKSVLATADEVRAWQSHVPPVRTRIAGMQGSRHAVEKVFTASMRNAKVDVEKLATIRSNHAAELNRLLKAEEAEALKGSAKAKTMLAANIASRREALQQLHNVPLTPALPTFITLTEPFLIWATPRRSALVIKLRSVAYPIACLTSLLSSGALPQLKASQLIGPTAA